MLFAGEGGMSLCPLLWICLCCKPYVTFFMVCQIRSNAGNIAESINPNKRHKIWIFSYVHKYIKTSVQ